jgi:hypothetical protein
MPARITTPQAIERSFYVISVTFQNEDGDEMTPKTMAWTLTDIYGTQMNAGTGTGERDYPVSMGSMATVMEFELQGNDLIIPESEPIDNGVVMRVLTLEGTYDSNRGSDLPFRDRIVFPLIRA